MISQLHQNRILRCLVILLLVVGYGHEVFGKWVPHHHGVEHSAIGDPDDDHGPAEDGDRHHDLTALSDGRLAKAAEQKVAASVWVLLCSVLTERFATDMREARKPLCHFEFEDSPPDERASGWLLVCQTARPVRGPSLVA